jgi:hypothetical protein
MVNGIQEQNNMSSPFCVAPFGRNTVNGTASRAGASAEVLKNKNRVLILQLNFQHCWNGGGTETHSRLPNRIWKYFSVFADNYSECQKVSICALSCTAM